MELNQEFHQQRFGQAKNIYGNREPKYAGFWIRLLAFLIDLVLLYAIGAILSFLGGTICGIMGVPTEIAINVIAPTIAWTSLFAYFIIPPVTAMQATFGKKICNLYIGDEDGNRISIQASFLRLIGMYVSGFLCIGFIMIGLNKKKRGLHDLIAFTYVYKSNKQE